MHRLFRVTAVFVAMFFLISGLRFVPSAAAQEGAGITSDTTYESPTFGFEIEWETSWVAQVEGTSSDDSGDSLYLFSEEYGSGITITAIAANGNSPDSFLESYRGYLEENYGRLTDGDFESSDPDAPAFLVTYDINDTAIDDYVQAIVYQDAMVLTSVRTTAGYGLIVAILASIEVQFEGENLLPSYTSSDDPDETPEPEETKDDPKTDRPVSRDETPEVPDGLEGYVSPTFGVSLAYDPELWTEAENTAAEDSSNDRDLLQLASADDDVPANLYIETYDSVTKASDCFDTAIEESVGDIDDAEVLEDRGGDPIEGSSRGTKYGAYSFETNSGDALVAYVECRAIPGGGGVFAVTLITVEDAYEDAYDALSDILDTVSLDGSAVEPEETVEPEEEDTPTTRSNNSGDYESPTYGFTIEYGRGWDVDSDTTDDGLDQLVLAGPDGITLLVQGYEPRARDEPQDCVEGYADSFATAVDIDVVAITDEDTDEPFAGEDDFGYYGLYAYEGGSGTRTLYIECGISPDGDYMVLFAAESAIESLETILDEVLPIIESTDF